MGRSPKVSGSSMHRHRPSTEVHTHTQSPKSALKRALLTPEKHSQRPPVSRRSSSARSCPACGTKEAFQGPAGKNEVTLGICIYYTPCRLAKASRHVASSRIAGMEAVHGP